MKACASAAAVATPGGTRLCALRSEAPLLLRETDDALYIVGGAAGPLGGDELSLAVDVGCGASLTVRSAAATMAQPGPHGRSSITRTRLDVGAGGSLEWQPEPLVSVHGSHHRIGTTVTLAADARLHLVEEVVLGRWDEASGRVTTSLRITRDGEPLVAHDLDLGLGAIGSSSEAVVGAARAVRTDVIVGPPAAPAQVHLDGSTRAASFPLAEDTTLVVALAATLPAARAATSRVS